MHTAFSQAQEVIPHFHSHPVCSLCFDHGPFSNTLTSLFPKFLCGCRELACATGATHTRCASQYSSIAAAIESVASNLCWISIKCCFVSVGCIFLGTSAFSGPTADFLACCRLMFRSFSTYPNSRSGCLA